MSSTTIYVTWKPPPQDRTNGRIMYYKLFFDEDGRNDAETPDSIKLNTTEFTLDELKRWTEYKIWISAGTSVGDGPRSQPVVCRTHEDGMYSTHNSIYSLTNIPYQKNSFSLD
jgi:netrin-G3 ligand